MNLTGRLGLSLFLALGPFGQHIPALAYPIVAVVIVATFLILVATVLERQGQGPLPVPLALRPYVGALQEQRQALRYRAALFLDGVGINTIQVNLTRFATHVPGAPMATRASCS